MKNYKPERKHEAIKQRHVAANKSAHDISSVAPISYAVTTATAETPVARSCTIPNIKIESVKPIAQIAAPKKKPRQPKNK